MIEKAADVLIIFIINYNDIIKYFIKVIIYNMFYSLSLLLLLLSGVFAEAQAYFK